MSMINPFVLTAWNTTNDDYELTTRKFSRIALDFCVGRETHIAGQLRALVSAQPRGGRRCASHAYGVQELGFDVERP
ncbi:hypothetical protein CYMTET_19650 [Cymbomonas tetramitiformis]|uniref:Uncharacterized protein n=1 Tax=Cymbomonas tetramitiformis TaxID=36881 RepID=A0AAE0L507_9CHLO|nr:hypothetical protein CYMTET_19650 [Cymbomonas tetramitiformis]